MFSIREFWNNWHSNFLKSAHSITVVQIIELISAEKLAEVEYLSNFVYGISHKDQYLFKVTIASAKVANVTGLSR